MVDVPSKPRRHPFLSGNFAPIRTELPLTPCEYIGTIPGELLGGEYVRNGGNPAFDHQMGRDLHWFDVSISVGHSQYVRKTPLIIA